MKVKILQKKEKVMPNGGSILSLFVSFDDKVLYVNILKYLSETLKVEKSKIDSFIRASEYNGVENYAFGLNCSKFTFNNVERFGIIDCEINFSKNDNGWVNARINIKDRIERVFGYEPPINEVSGWECGNPEQADESPLPTWSTNSAIDNIGKEPILPTQKPTDDLPF